MKHIYQIDCKSNLTGNYITTYFEGTEEELDLHFSKLYQKSLQVIGETIIG